ncbi:MAG: sigma 54-interacting transcriptional regulator [Myxococcaceae bacterium]
MIEGGKTSSLRGLTIGAIPEIRLYVLDGPDRGAEVRLQLGTAVIGTRSDCELVLTDPTVSKRHLAVELLAGRLRVKDLQSKNGTRYLGAKVDSVEVPPGSIISVGQTRIALLPSKLPAGALSDRTELGGLVGHSVPMRRLYAEIERVAATEAPVLIHGETGTGKELVAQALHDLSGRAKGPFRVVDCASLSPELVQSTLFGHVRGAFTGAVTDARGALEQADGGTLFLDEVGELPLDQQGAILRALETGTFTRLGENVARKSDFRILCATHRDLEAEVKQGRFRRDLYFRLVALKVNVPPLRERLEDIPRLVEHFATSVDSRLRLPPAAVAALCAYVWPGNVRELRNMVNRALATGATPELPGAEQRPPPADFHQARQQTLKAFEKSYLEALLARHEGSPTAAAREAGLARSYFYRLLEEHGLRPKSRRRS